MAKYVPKIGDVVTLELPGERTRAKIVRKTSNTMVIAQLLHFTTSRQHNYHKDDFVPAEYTPAPLGGTYIWCAIAEGRLAGKAPEPVAAEAPRGEMG